MRVETASWTLMIVAAGAPAIAQEDVLITDRPGYSDGTSLMRPGALQFESGSTIGGSQKFLGADSPEWRQRYISGGTPMVRLGLTRRLELRLGTEGMLYHREHTGPIRILESGYSDVAAGVKIGLWEERRFVPAVTVIPLISLPAGTPEFSSTGLDPTVKIAWSKNMPGEYTISGNWNVSCVTAGVGDSGEHLRETWNAASLQISRPLWRNVSGFAEAYVIQPGNSSDPRAWNVDTGIAYVVRPNLQVDVSGGQQIAPWNRTWFIAVGVAVRMHLFGERASAR